MAIAEDWEIEMVEINIPAEYLEEDAYLDWYEFSKFLQSQTEKPKDNP